MKNLENRPTTSRREQERQMARHEVAWAEYWRIDAADEQMLRRRMAEQIAERQKARDK
jgi:hypothetical protein